MKKRIQNYIIFLLSIFILVLIFYIFKIESDIKLIESEKTNNINTLKRNFFWDNFSLNDYKDVDFKITDEWKRLIYNARKLKSTKTLIDPQNRDKELCAWYIWTLTEKIWGNMSPYYVGMINRKTQKPAKAWELPSYYEYFWWKQLINFSDKFDLEKKDLYSKLEKKDLKEFFLKAFSEQALLWDIGFLYKDSGYIGFLKWWNSNSHIAKNIWIWDFSFKIINPKDNFWDILWCDKETYKNLKNILENYKLFLNKKRIVFYNKDFYYLKENKIIWDKVKFKFWDEILYKDIVILHFYDKKARVDSLFQFICWWKFLPINIISINPRFIEKI